MQRLVYSIKSIECVNKQDRYLLKVNAITANINDKNPQLISCIQIPEKELLKEICFEFHAETEDIMFPALGSLSVEKEIKKSDYPNLQKIVVKAKTNEKSIDV